MTLGQRLASQYLLHAALTPKPRFTPGDLETILIACPLETHLINSMKSAYFEDKILYIFFFGPVAYFDRLLSSPPPPSPSHLSTG